MTNFLRPPHECPACGAGSKILQSKARTVLTYKRRECSRCNEIWSTVEITKEYYDELKKKKDFVDRVMEEVVNV